MQVAFIIVAVSASLFVVFARRQFDLLSLAILGAVIYFMPGFWGYATYPTSSGGMPVALVGETYGVMIAVLVAILVAALLSDALASREPIRLRISGGAYVGEIAMLLCFVGLSLSLLTTGQALFNPDKAAMVQELNRWHIMWSMSASISTVVLFTGGKRKLMLVPLAILFFDTYIGFRMAIANTILCLFVLALYPRGQTRLAISQWKLLVLGAISGVSLFVYKYLYTLVKLGLWQTVSARLGSSELYVIAITRSEPFTIQAILNKTIESDFSVGMGHFTNVLYQFMLFSNELGASQVSFGDIFQSQHFSTLSFGIASNIWAEMWASGGWPLLLVWILLWVTALTLLSRALAIVDPAIRGTLALMGAYLAFYVHRNGLEYLVNLEKRIFLLAIFCTIASVLVSSAATRAVGQAKR